MNIWIRVKAKIDKKRPELCSWSCLHHFIDVVDGRTIAHCTAYHTILKLTTLSKPAGKEMLRRCRACRDNTLRIA